MAEIEGKMGVLTEQQTKEYRDAFNMYDKDGNESIDKEEIRSLLQDLHVQVPNYKLRDLKLNYGDTIEFEEFIEIVKEHSDALSGSQFLDMLTKTNVEHIGGISEGSAEGTTHSYSEAETAAFADWVNSQLIHDEELTGYLPIDSANNYKEMFDKVKDGVLLCKLINATVKDTIDMRAVNKKNLKVFTIHENQTLVINSAASIGCHLVNIGPEDLANGKQHLVLGLLWQVIRIGLFSNITLTNVPGLTKLLHEGEEISDLHKLSPEELLIRWVNYQLKEAKSERRITNFSEDITDSEVYSVLLHHIAPSQSGIDRPQTYHSIDSPLKKADHVLRNADKIGCKKFVRSKDIVEGNQKLNLAFVANLFNKYPNLPFLEENEDEINQDNENAYREETDEERTYRNWMNSLGVNPFVTWLYSDLTNGLVLLQLYDSIQPGIVNWKKVNPIEACKKKISGYLKEVENCNYAVEIGKQMNFKIVAFGGKDLHDVSDSTELYTLGLVWQMMRAYTYSILARLAPEGGAPLKDNDILVWVNEKLTKNKKPNITSFKAGEISTSLPVIDLIDCISSKVVDYSQVNKGISDEDMMSNARYALSLARKIGAQIYALPKDLVEVKSKMVLTIFACLMACSLAKEKEEEEKKKRPGKKLGKK